MKRELQQFGNPALFEIAARWLPDTEPRERLPLAEGWSRGAFRITVCGQVLTEHRLRVGVQADLSWYLSPILDWLIRNWTWLWHEERYAWAEKSGQPAAVAVLSALERTIAATDEIDRQAYASIHAWWARHALRAADSSALYPDIHFRRVADDIEVSWLSRQPAFAPRDFSLTLAPGYALLPVRAVAEPLWQFLAWATSTAPVENQGDRAIASELKTRFEALSATPLAHMEQAYVGAQVQALLEQARRDVGLANDSRHVGGLPVIDAMDSAVLMFGGLNVALGQADANRLLAFLHGQRGRAESAELASLARNPESDAWSRPYEEGYRLAEECREDLDISADELCVDMSAVLNKLGIEVIQEELETSAIRGVAVAGEGYSPAILINMRSFYNIQETGRRFTLAHELCHILHDRTRARRLSHLSGPWSSARTEKRANAFAAMFLAPPSAIRHKLNDITPESVSQLAAEVGMGLTAFVEHLYNVDLIDEAEREALRQS